MLLSSYLTESISCSKSINGAPWNLLRVGTLRLHRFIYKILASHFIERLSFLLRSYS